MRRITLNEGEYYHIYNRGVDKRVVFTKPQEYRRFMRALVLLNDIRVVKLSRHLAKSFPGEVKPLPEIHRRGKGRPEKELLAGTQRREPLVAIGAFCLMPNHFHLYLTPLVDNGISKFMQRLQTSYTMYFNEVHERSGALFQGTFKAEHVDRDAYAKYLFSYIHLNPAKLVDSKWKEFGARDFRNVREYVRTYQYSSLPEYLGKKHIVTDPSKFPQYFSSLRDIDAHIDTWLANKILQV
ncbi:MAG: transposase [Patescibacteria group bacterium]|nr:transposase [Patescibacteria group bacterium]